MTATAEESQHDNGYSWFRLGISLLLATVGGVGIWSAVIFLPSIEAEFNTDRGSASLPYLATMLGFALGGIFMGRMVDRFGILPPLILSAVSLVIGYTLISFSDSYWQYVVLQVIFIGMFGTSTTFGPLVADISHWFMKRRGIAVAICASGNYLAGAIWTPFIQMLIEHFGWRQAHLIVGLICVVIMIPLALLLRKRADMGTTPNAVSASRFAGRLPISKGALFGLLAIAGVACCVAMAMPQVHMIAYCIDLGYGEFPGGQMLSIMLVTGVISRMVSGYIADYIGGVGTLILGSGLQCLALFLYIPFDGLASLYLVSALFGLSQGGIVPSYALIVRDYFPSREAGWRISLVLMATVLGMALGGWLSGEIYDWTGSYTAAFLHGIGWNLLNLAIASFILFGKWWVRRADLAAA
jgi:MFS family permease